MTETRIAAVVLALLAACVAGACAASFSGPANPPDDPWVVVCDGGGRCPRDHECRGDGTCVFAGELGKAHDAGAE